MTICRLDVSSWRWWQDGLLEEMTRKQSRQNGTLLTFVPIKGRRGNSNTGDRGSSAPKPFACVVFLFLEVKGQKI